MADQQSMAVEISEQIRDTKKDVRFGTREYVAEYLINKFNEDEFYIPLDYQRNFVWGDAECSYFIESVLIGLPIPYMFFADAEDGRTEIVDGAQRINALVSFVRGDLILRNLKLLTTVNGKKYSDLPKDVQRRFDNANFRVVYLEQGTSFDVRQEIFHRINSSGMLLQPQEIRRGSMGGDFTKLVSELSQDPLFMKLAPLSETALKHFDNMELVTRFFAYTDGYPDFEGYKDRVANYLDQYTDRMNNELAESPDKRDQLASCFKEMLEYVEKCLGDRGFKKTPTGKSTPHARFEAIAVGVAVALAGDRGLSPKDMSWIDDEEFQNLVRSDSANVKAKLKARIDFVADKLKAE